MQPSNTPDRLEPWKAKIRAAREKTPFRDFVREVASWCSLYFYALDGRVSSYPQSDRAVNLVGAKEFAARDNSELVTRDYDPSRPFFEQFSEFHREAAYPMLWDFGGFTENCAYSQSVGWGMKNAYLTISAGMDCENVLYSFEVSNHCTDIVSSVGVRDACASIYMSSGVTRSYQVFYSRYIEDSSDVWFSTNLQGCHECIACDDLQNQSYRIENIAYPKEEYMERKREYLASVRDHDARYHALASIRSSNRSSADSSGKFLVRCEEVENSLYAVGVKRGRNIMFVGDGTKIEDCYDNACSWTAAERSYANFACSPGVDIYFNMYGTLLSDCFHGRYCQNSHHLIGCVGLQNAAYCIFNKQYSEDEWYRLAEGIFAGLEARGELASYAPPSMNPLYFNDTLAALVLDYDREDIVSRGYLWRDEEARVDIPAGAEIVDVATIDPRVYDESIKKKVLRDANGKHYRIVPMEYAFLRKHDLPLPTTHWQDRMREGLRFH